MATSNYRENHYVPQWYQRQFLPITGDKKFYYLDLKPESFLDATGRKRYKTALRKWGTNLCFKETDLYTTSFGNWGSTDIERYFFGRVDDNGCKACKYFENFTHPDANEKAFYDFLNFMSIQKFRTPKGLFYLSELTNLRDKNNVLLAMQRIQNLHCAIWTEAVWSIADATDSATKFILSDHPVTVYNEDCFPDLNGVRVIAILKFGD